MSGHRCTPEQVAEAQQSVSARRVSEHYSTTDSEYDENDESIGARPAASHDMYSMYSCYGSSNRFHKAFSGLVDRWAAEADRRAAKRLKAIGRRAYALELVARDHARGYAVLPVDYHPASETLPQVRNLPATSSSTFTRGSAPSTRSRSPPLNPDANASPNLASPKAILAKLGRSRRSRGTLTNHGELEKYTCLPKLNHHRKPHRCFPLSARIGVGNAGRRQCRPISVSDVARQAVLKEMRVRGLIPKKEAVVG